MVITKSFNLDINTPWKAPTLYIKQGDVDSRKLQATIRKDGTNYSIPGDVTATFRMKKPDGTIVTQDATISGSVVSVVMDAQCSTAAGHAFGEIVLATAGEVVSTFLLAIDVMAAAVTDGDIESRDALSEYRGLVDEMLRVKGSPLTANTAAAMTDTDRVYVYTGSEVGYVNGSWYYYDGASWQVGGVYNSQAISDAFYNDIAQLVKQSAVASESDSVPYLFRHTPNPSAILADEEIVGGTIAWNQLINTLPATTTLNGVTITNNGNGTFTTSGTATANTQFQLVGAMNVINGHKAVVRGCPAGGSDATYKLGTSGTKHDLGDGAYVSNTSATRYIWLDVKSGTNMNGKTFAPQYTDITSALGSSIANYLYTLESGTAGAGVAKLREWGFLSKVYFPYNAGELKSVNTEGKEVVSRNLLNPSALVGTNITFDGAEYVGTATAFNTAFGSSVPLNIPIIPGMQYTISAEAYTPGASGTSGNGLVFRLYGTDASTINATFPNNTSAWTKKSATLAAGKTLDKLAVTVSSVGGNVWHVRNVQLEIAPSATAFTPYRSTTYPTTPTDLNGIFNLDANNNLYADGDRYKADGTITRNYTYRNYQAGDESLANAITDGVHTVVKKNTPTTDTADPYTATQISGKGGTEEWIDNRSVPVPVGHNTVYSIGVPDVPANANAATLKATVSGGKTTLSWS